MCKIKTTRIESCVQMAEAHPVPDSQKCAECYEILNMQTDKHDNPTTHSYYALCTKNKGKVMLFL
jgi:hypothetical protein